MQDCHEILMCSWHVSLPSSVPTCQSYNMKMATQNSINLMLQNITCWVFRWLGLWACAWEHVKPLGISSFEICTRELRIAVSGFVLHAIMVSLVLYPVRSSLVHRKNIERSKESSFYTTFHCSSVWNKGRDPNRLRGKAIKPTVLEERKHEV